ncbi:MAG: hypothetical protein ACLPX9_09695 [Rhodomicrobium sp.]
MASHRGTQRAGGYAIFPYQPLPVRPEGSPVFLNRQTAARPAITTRPRTAPTAPRLPARRGGGARRWGRVFYWDGGPEGMLLMEFVAKLLYPDRFAGLDLTAEVQDYYARFYGYRLSAGQAALLLQGRSPDGSRFNPMNN